MRDSDERLIRIEDKLDKVVDRVSSCDITLAAQHVTLTEHMRRTALLEIAVEPMVKHVAMVSGALKVLAVLAGLISVVAAGVEILLYLKR